MKGPSFVRLYFVLFLLLLIASCGGGGSSSTGTLSVGLTDSSTDHYSAVYVTISEVQVQKPGDKWKVVGKPNKTYNLLELVNGVRETLGIAELEAGDYTQMRLIIGGTPDEGLNILSRQHPYANYVIDLDDNTHELKVPSGYQTGVKIVEGFTISADQTTELILDFSASESVVVAGSSGNWLLKPTVKVLNTREYAIISGTVDDEGSGLSGVLISAQVYNADPSVDLKDRVMIQASTITDESGKYKLFLEPGNYQIVAYITGYDPEVDCSVTLSSGQVVEGYDFTLISGPSGDVTTTVNIAGSDPELYATVSFRQLVSCDEDDSDGIEIQVTATNVLNGSSDTVSLPVGVYTVVASSYGKDTQEEGLEVDDDTTLEINM